MLHLPPKLWFKTQFPFCKHISINAVFVIVSLQNPPLIFFGFHETGYATGSKDRFWQKQIILGGLRSDSGLSIFVERSDEEREGEKRISNKEELRRREFQGQLLAQRRVVYTHSSPSLMWLVAEFIDLWIYPPVRGLWIWLLITVTTPHFPLLAVRELTHDGRLSTNHESVLKLSKVSFRGKYVHTGNHLKLPSPTKLARLGHFPPANQAGRLARPVFYIISFLWQLPRQRPPSGASSPTRNVHIRATSYETLTPASDRKLKFSWSAMILLKRLTFGRRWHFKIQSI